VVPSGELGRVYRSNEKDAGRAELRLTQNHRRQIARFERVFAQNRARYEAVSRATGVPPQLVAAIHYRESSMNFGTYLHQGDRLGRPAQRHPRDIPVFHRWEDAAIHALKQKDGVRRALGITANTTNPAALATFAERYNGLGYHNRGKASPYVWAGTNIYTGGRYVADRQYDPNSWDRRPGVMTLVAAANGTSLGTGSIANQTPEQAWSQVTAGNERLRRGVRSEAVTYLQGALRGLGFEIAVDGDFGRATEAAVRRFQARHGLAVDGVVGSATAAKINELMRAQGENSNN
jgi:lysozyme family protein